MSSSLLESRLRLANRQEICHNFNIKKEKKRMLLVFNFTWAAIVSVLLVSATRLVQFLQVDEARA